MILLKIIGFFLLFLLLVGVLSILFLVIIGFRLKAKLQQNLKENLGENIKGPKQTNHGIDADLELVACPHCGVFIAKGSISCSSCGKDL